MARISNILWITALLLSILGLSLRLFGKREEEYYPIVEFNNPLSGLEMEAQESGSSVVY